MILRSLPGAGRGRPGRGRQPEVRTTLPPVRLAAG